MGVGEGSWGGEEREGGGGGERDFYEAMKV
jgi:hypothetical protein